MNNISFKTIIKIILGSSFLFLAACNSFKSPREKGKLSSGGADSNLDARNAAKNIPNEDNPNNFDEILVNALIDDQGQNITETITVKKPILGGDVRSSFIGLSDPNDSTAGLSGESFIDEGQTSTSTTTSDSQRSQAETGLLNTTEGNFDYIDDSSSRPGVPYPGAAGSQVRMASGPSSNDNVGNQVDKGSPRIPNPGMGIANSGLKGPINRNDSRNDINDPALSNRGPSSPLLPQTVLPYEPSLKETVKPAVSNKVPVKATPKTISTQVKGKSNSNFTSKPIEKNAKTSKSTNKTPNKSNTKSPAKTTNAAKNKKAPVKSSSNKAASGKAPTKKKTSTTKTSTKSNAKTNTTKASSKVNTSKTVSSKAVS
ncbi:hypothetical protein ABSA28_01097 [Candidatus Hepatincolaceae symbiont of Richtersius coronifer]